MSKNSCFSGGWFRRLLSTVLAIGILISMIGVQSVSADAAGLLKVAVLSEPRVFPQAMISNSAAFAAAVNGEQAMLAESQAILDAAILRVISQNPDVLLVPGNLTKDGEVQAHTYLASKLNELKRNLPGLKIYVVNGGKDINNPNASTYASGSVVKVESATPETFRGIYSGLGYGDSQADYFVPSSGMAGSNSYAARPAPGYTVIAVDTAKYSADATSDGANEQENGGAISGELRAWILEKTQEAESAGETVITFMSHGIVPHFSWQADLLKDTLIDNFAEVGTELAAGGVRYAFTGAMRANDISQVAAGENTLSDIQTGSVSSYPSPIRLVSFTKGISADRKPTEKAEISVELVKSINYTDPQTGNQITDLTEYGSRFVTSDAITSIILNSGLTSMLDGLLDTLLVTEFTTNRGANHSGIRAVVESALPVTDDSGNTVSNDIGDVLLTAMRGSLPTTEADGINIGDLGKAYYNVGANRLQININIAQVYITDSNLKTYLVDSTFRQIDDKFIRDKTAIHNIINNAFKRIMEMDVYPLPQPDGNGGFTAPGSQYQFSDLAKKAYLSHLAGDEQIEPWMTEVIESFNSGPILDLAVSIFAEELGKGISEALNSVTVDMNRLLTSNLLGTAAKMMVISMLGNNLGGITSAMGLDVESMFGGNISSILPAEVLSAVTAIVSETILSLSIDNNYSQDNQTTLTWVGTETIAIDKSALIAAIDRASSLIQADYTPSSWRLLTEELIAARTVMDDASAAQVTVDEALANLTRVIESLVPAADRGALGVKLSEAGRLSEDDYEPASWALFSAERSAAQAVFDNADATQTEVNTALAALTAAIDNLVLIPPVDKAALGAKLNEAFGLNESDYIADSWARFVSIRDNSQWVYNDENATQASVDSALAALSEAIEALELIPAVDKAALLAKLEQADAQNQAIYTPESWTLFAAVRSAARSVYNNGNATQQQVDDAVIGLTNAINNLVLIPTVDKAALLAKLNEAFGLNESDYIADSWVRFVSIRDNSQWVYNDENATQASVDSALAALSEAIEALELIPTVDKAALLAKLEQADAQNQAIYTPESWTLFAVVRNAARSVYNNGNATQQQVDDAVIGLTNAISNLVLIPTVDKAALLAKLEQADAQNQAIYTPESWTLFAVVRNAARSVYNNGNATQQQVDDAVLSLTNAINNLVEKPVVAGTVVMTIEQLRTALADSSVEKIVLGNSIKANGNPWLELNHSAEIYGQGYTLDLGGYYINMVFGGTLSVSEITMMSTDYFGFFTAYSPLISNAGVWNVNFTDVKFEGSALVGQRTYSVDYGTIDTVNFYGSADISIKGVRAVYAAVYASRVNIDGGGFSMTGANDSIFFKSVNSSGVGAETNAFGGFSVANNANVKLTRAPSSPTFNYYYSNLVEGYESYVFGENSVFEATAGTNISESNRGYAQTAIIHSGSAREFTVKNGARVKLISDYSPAFAGSHGSTALSLRKPERGTLAFTVAKDAVLDITAYGSNASARDLAPVLILSKVSDNSGASYVNVQGTLNVYSRNGNGWYYQYIDYNTAGNDVFTVDGGIVNINADGKIGRSISGEYAALEHYGPTPFTLDVKNGGVMSIKTHGWRAMSLAGGYLLGTPDKKITVQGVGSTLSINGGQFAIAAEGKTKFELNVLGGGHASTWNTQDANVYTTGQATYNVDGAGSRLEMVRSGVSEDSGDSDKTSLYGVIFHDAPLVGPLKINVTNGGYMSAENSFGSRAAITAQNNFISSHAINVSGDDSTLRVINNNKGNSFANDTSLYPVGAVAFAANCSGDITIKDGGNFYAESYSPDSPTVALGGYGTLNRSGALLLENPGTVDIQNNAATENIRAIALRGRNYDPINSTDTVFALSVADSDVSVWPVSASPSWTAGSTIEKWISVNFDAANGAGGRVNPGSLKGLTMFNLRQYSRILVS